MCSHRRTSKGRACPLRCGAPQRWDAHCPGPGSVTAPQFKNCAGDSMPCPRCRPKRLSSDLCLLPETCRPQRTPLCQIWAVEFLSSSPWEHSLSTPQLAKECRRFARLEISRQSGLVCHWVNGFHGGKKLCSASETARRWDQQNKILSGNGLWRKEVARSRIIPAPE